MTINDLLVLPHDEIDYASLGAGMLRELAIQNSEPYIATSALAELGARSVPEARAAAAAILAAEPWDRHLFAFAITTLCDIDRDDATETMERLLDRTNDPKVLGAMVECVLSDADHFRVGHGRAFTDRLAAKVEAVQPDQFTDLDERAAFLARYPRCAEETGGHRE
jgi:uncharacterized protein with von Willebrand factor type A (vWA) domain